MDLFEKDWTYAKPNSSQIAYTNPEFRDFLWYLDLHHALGPVRVDLGCGWNPVTNAWFQIRPRCESQWLEACPRIAAWFFKQYLSQSE